MKGYDKIVENDSLLLDIPFREGVGTTMMDYAKPHHPVVSKDPGTGTLTWDSLASGLSVLDFLPAGGGAAQGNYLECVAADTVDLNFTTSDYSFSIWMYQTAGSTLSQILSGKYALDVKGWEIYTTISGALRYLSLRHHHAGGASARTACYSLGWEHSKWWLVGISRSGGYPLMYRNGEEVDMVYSVGGLENPESAVASDLILGARYTKDADWLSGKYCRPRIWNRALSQKEWANIFQRERDWFGV